MLIKEVDTTLPDQINRRLTKHHLKDSGSLVNLGFISSIKSATSDEKLTFGDAMTFVMV